MPGMEASPRDSTAGLHPQQVPIPPLQPERFRSLLGDESWSEWEQTIASAREVFAGRAIWHINSTARGGGVAEMLQSLLAYARGAGVDARWFAITAGPAFFEVTKRIHNNLHGAIGDGGPLGHEERKTYEAGLGANAAELREIVRSGDVVFLHDPQPAGLARTMREAGAHVVWRCHVGLDVPNETARRAWEFLRPYVEEADSYVFSRPAYAWEGLEDKKTWIVPPSIDGFSPKNQELSPATVASIIEAIGLSAGDSQAPAAFVHMDGTPGRVDRHAEVDEDTFLPPDARSVIQVSRWDRLKDPSGLVECFAAHCDRPDVHLVLAGPSVEAVADDPEGAEVLEQVRAQRRALATGLRERVHLVTLPMIDIDENAAMVNALQRRADVIVQKSIAEGFGLTVAEAMWKGKPVVAGRIGGIQDQIVDGESGILIDDPRDLDAFGTAIKGLISDPERAGRIGLAARGRVRDEFLGTRHLTQYLRLLGALIG
jgi:trehalose synthase